MHTAHVLSQQSRGKRSGRYGLFLQHEREIRIFLPPTQDEHRTLEMLMSLAHEAGHLETLDTPGLRPDDLEFATYRRNYEKGNYTVADRTLVVAEEKQAWKLGEQLLRKVAPGLPDDFWMLLQRIKPTLIKEYEDDPAV